MKHLPISLLWSIFTIAASGCATDAARQVAHHPAEQASPSASPVPPGSAQSSTGVASGTPTETVTPAETIAPAEAVTSAAVATPASADIEAEQVRQLLMTLQAGGQLNPSLAQQLAGDLQQADPGQRGMLLQLLRASMSQQPGSDAPSMQAALAPPEMMQLAGRPALQAISPQAPLLQPVPIGQHQQSLSPPMLAPPQVADTAQPHQAARPHDVLEMASAAAAPPSNLMPPATAPTAATGSPVQLVSAEIPMGPAPWRQPLEAAIASLNSSTTTPGSNDAVRREVYLRMLLLAAGRRDDALRPIEGISPDEQQYWTDQLYTLATYLDAERLPDAATRAAEARRHLARAVDHLGKASLLVVKNLAFCTEVNSFGMYKRFEQYQFKPGQRLLLYAELENFHSEPTQQGFHTALRSSYQIFDSRGQRVTGEDLALTEEYCQNARRDYFIRYFLSVPTRIYDGRYTLQLTIEDTLGRKIGQSTIDFVVSENSSSHVASTWPAAK